MKTVGERIRQARDARGLSGEELAHAVGYKNQSAISNLENRATGTGGTKIAKIATALRVPVQRLLEGPDGPEVPFSDPMVTDFKPVSTRTPGATKAEAQLDMTAKLITGGVVAAVAIGLLVLLR